MTVTVYVPGPKSVRSSWLAITLIPCIQTYVNGKVPPDTVKSIVPFPLLLQVIFVGTNPIDKGLGSVIVNVSNVVQFEASVTVTV